MRRRSLLGGLTLGAMAAAWPRRGAAAGEAAVVRVGLYKAAGVHPVAFAAEKALLERSAGFVCTVLTPAEVQRGALARQCSTPASARVPIVPGELGGDVVALGGAALVQQTFDMPAAMLPSMVI